MLKVAGTTIAAVALVATGLGASVAVATSGDGPTCHVISQTSHPESRDVTGQPAAATKVGPVRKVIAYRNGKRVVTYVRTVWRYTYSGTMTRTTTVTETKCGRDVTTTSSSTPWTGAKIITTRTVQRVR